MYSLLGKMETESNSDNGIKCLKISCILSFLLIFYALATLTRNPAQGYEVSIYESTNPIILMAIIIGLLNGIICIFYSISYKKSNIWSVGFFEIIFCNILLILLSTLRGYLLANTTDSMGYIGDAIDISINGNFLDNFYPITSILMSVVNQISGISVLEASYILPAFFFTMYMLSIYCLAKSLNSNRNYALAAFISATPIFFCSFPVSIYHMFLAVMTIPLLFYCLQNRFDWRFRLLSGILCLLFPFFHPIVALVLLFYLIIYYLIDIYHLKYLDAGKSVIMLLSLYFVSLAEWYSLQYILVKNIYSIILRIVTSSKDTTAVEAGYYLNTLGFVRSLETFLLMQCDEIIFYILLLIAIYYIVFKKNKLEEYKFIPISLSLITGSLFLLALFFFTRIHTPTRLMNLNFNMVLIPPLVGYLIFRFSQSKEKFRAGIILGLVLISVISSFFTLYESPLISKPNAQLTLSEYNGGKWLIYQKSLEVSAIGLQSVPYRYAEMILGVKAQMARNDLPMYFPEIPNHFGFINTSIFPSKRDIYFIITDFDIIAYTKVWEDLHKFEKGDFLRLNLSRNIDKLYDNGHFITYFVYKATL